MKSQSRKSSGSVLIGEFLRKHRKLSGLTQRQAAKALGVHPMFISNIENNKAPLPYHHLLKISLIYSISRKKLTAELLKAQKHLIEKFL